MMIHIIFSLLLSLKNDSIFRGNCTVQTTNKNTFFKSNKADFVITLGSEKTKYNNTFLCDIEFFTINPIEVDEKFDLYGFKLNEDEYLFYQDYLRRSLNRSIEYLYNITQELQTSNISQIETHLIQKSSAMPIIAYFKIGEREPNPKQFIANRTIVGHFSVHNVTYFNFTGNELNKIKFIGEGRSLGVIMSIYAALNFYAWHILSVRYKSRSLLSHFSEHSLLLHIGYDFCLLFFALDMSMSNNHFLQVFLFLFLVMIIIFFEKQMEVLATVWRANQDVALEANMNDLNNDRMREIKLRLLIFFIEMSFIIILSSILTTFVFLAPYISIIYLYITFLPQIFHLAKINPRIIKADYFFTTTIYIIRLIPLCYFAFYPMNLMLTFSIPFGIFVFSIWTLQFVILILQNRFGGDFFMPQSFRIETFDYSNIRDNNPDHSECPICMCQILENDQTMTPPCGHTFHRHCLRRWMEEELICPVCRAPLPPENRSRRTLN